MNPGIDAQCGEEVVAQIVPGHGWQSQVVGARRVLGEVLPGEALLLVEQRAHSLVLLPEKLLQRLDVDLRCVAQGRQVLQRQVAAHRMVGPAPRHRRRSTKQQQEECQLHCLVLIGCAVRVEPNNRPCP
ncbi:hypothetical protein D3C72_2052670 [compost metagenome]